MKPSLFAIALICLAPPLPAPSRFTPGPTANGTKHFSDTPPPPNTPTAKKLTVRNGVTSEEVEAPADATPKEGPTMAAAAGYSAEDITRNCAAARKNLDAYNAAKPAEDAEPEAQILYQENISKAQSQIKLFCG